MLDIAVGKKTSRIIMSDVDAVNLESLLVKYQEYLKHKVRSDFNFFILLRFRIIAK
jgi:hypothetical protein